MVAALITNPKGISLKSLIEQVEGGKNVPERFETFFGTATQ